MTGRSCSRAHTDSSAPPVPNPISGSDSRISPQKQAVRQRSQTTPIRKRRNTKVLRLSPISRTAGHTSIPVFSPARIRFRCSISESVHGNRRSGRRTQSALIQKWRNPAVPRPRPASRQTGHSSKAGPNPISTANLRTGPRVAATAADGSNRVHTKTAEHQGSLITANRSHS